MTKQEKLEQVIDMIVQELDRSEKIFPGWPDDKIHAASIVSEESGELVQACNNYQFGDYTNKDRMVEEAVQTAAMAVRFLVNV